jgi:hypothetical protein
MVEGWQEGRVVPVSVVEVEGKLVAEDTAHAYLKMREAAASEGLPLRLISGWRSNDEQSTIYASYQRGTGPFAFPPGYSRHQDGTALDLTVDDPQVYDWLERNAGRFGFSRTIPIEPWHWEFTGWRAGRGIEQPASMPLGAKIALGLGITAVAGVIVWSLSQRRPQKTYRPRSKTQ